MRQAVSNAGIVQGEDGRQQIPASRRKDGTTRAPIRIRPGYVPTEDVAKYRPPKHRSVLPDPGPRQQLVDVKSDHDISNRSSHAGQVDHASVKTESEGGTVPEDERDRASTEPKARPPAQIPVTKTLKSTWAEAGWKGGAGTPSRFASKAAAISRVSESGDTKIAISPTSSSKDEKNGRGASQKSHKAHVVTKDKVAEDVDDLGARLRTVGLSETSPK